MTVAPGYTYRDGLEQGPSPYLRWGIVEDVYAEDVTYPAYDEFGNRDTDIPLGYARSVTVRWLYHGGGRSTVRCLETWGVTSMPMKGTIVVVGFIGGPGGEPIVLGYWTQGYNQRLLKEGGSGEIGPGLRPGQEVWRRSGWRLRVIPYYDDVREFAERYTISPWALDIIAGEQHDIACFCPKCQTRYPATESRDEETGRIKFSCPTTCPECDGGKPVLVTGSVAGGEGEAWLAVQETLLVNTIMQELSDLYDGIVVGAGIRDMRLQIDIQKRWKQFRDTKLRIAWGAAVGSYYRNQVVRYWESILREYFTVGNLLDYADDAPGQTNTLVILLNQYVEGWLFTHLTNYLKVDGRLTEAQRNALMNTLGENLRTYIQDYTPRVIEQMTKQAIMNKARTYVTELVARLRRKAVNWLHKSFLKSAKDAALSAIRDQLDRDWSGFRWVRDTAAQAVADFYEKVAAFDLASEMRDALAEGLEDPEELPILELRGDQDVRSVLNPQSGREEGQGEKAPRFRLKLYRDGEVHIQVQEGLFLYLRSDGTVELDCDNIDVTANALNALLRDRSGITIQDVLTIGNPVGSKGPVPFKKVTLDEDNVREYDPGLLAGVSTRDFVRKVGWKDTAGKLAPMMDAAAALCVNPLLAQVVTAFESIATTLRALNSTTVPPPPNSIIGNTEASADHLEGN